MLATGAVAFRAPRGSISTTPISDRLARGGRRGGPQYRRGRRGGALSPPPAAVRRRFDCFLDSTTLWFEGAGGENLGQRPLQGLPRALETSRALLDDGDRPIASLSLSKGLMPGNTTDVTMLLPAVDTRSLCLPSSSVCKHCKLGFVIDTTRATGSANSPQPPVYGAGRQCGFGRERRAQPARRGGCRGQSAVGRGGAKRRALWRLHTQFVL